MHKQWRLCPEERQGQLAHGAVTTAHHQGAAEPGPRLFYLQEQLICPRFPSCICSQLQRSSLLLPHRGPAPDRRAHARLGAGLAPPPLLSQPRAEGSVTGAGTRDHVAEGKCRAGTRSQPQGVTRSQRRNSKGQPHPEYPPPAMGVQPPNFSWVLPGRLAGLALPRLPAHYQFLLDLGVRHLVSLTERGPPHSDSCPGLTLHRLRIPDFCPPAPEQIDQFVKIVDEANAKGEVSECEPKRGWGLEGTEWAGPGGRVESEGEKERLWAGQGWAGRRWAGRGQVGQGWAGVRWNPPTDQRQLRG